MVRWRACAWNADEVVATHNCGKCGGTNVKWVQTYVTACSDCGYCTKIGFHFVKETQHFANGETIHDGWYYGEQGSEKTGPFTTREAAFDSWETGTTDPPIIRAAKPNLIYLGKMLCPSSDCEKKADVITVGVRSLLVCKFCHLLRDISKHIDEASTKMMDSIRKAGEFETEPGVSVHPSIEAPKTFKRIA